MSVPSGASEVTIRNVPPKLSSLPARTRDVLRIVAIAEWGPMGEATIDTDYDGWSKKFGGFIANYYSAIAVRDFFASGGRVVITVRTCRYAGTTSPVTAAKSFKMHQTGATAPTKGSVTGSTVGPWALANGDTLKGNVDAVGIQTATISATAALRENTPAEPYALANLQVLTVKIDGGAPQTITFLTGQFVNIAAATAEEVAAVIAASLLGATVTVTAGGTKITITSDRKGTGSYVEVTGGTANGVLSFNVASVQGTGNVSNVLSVTDAELKTIIELAWTNGGGVTVSAVVGALKIEADTAGVAGSVLVDSTSTAEDELGLVPNVTYSGSDGTAVNTLKLWGKYYGVLGNGLSYDIAAASSGEAGRFDLFVYRLGALAEPVWRNLSMDSADATYAETVLNADSTGSMYVTADDQAPAGTPAQRRPVNATSQALAGGSDGLAALDATDFVGTQAAGNGLYAFDVMVEDGDILICPDCTAAAFQNLATAKCAGDWKYTCVFIPDCAAGSNYTTVAIQAQNLTASEGRTGLPWPRVKVPNPDKNVYGAGDTITVPVSGEWAARMAQNTLLYQEDVFKQPGNQIFGALSNAVDVETDEVQKDNVRHYVSSYGINPIIKGKKVDGTFGVWVNDVQGGDRTGNFRSVGEIRGMALVRKDLKAFAETERTQGNTEDSRWKQQFKLETYFLGWTLLGVFASLNPSRAFRVNTDPLGQTINNPLEQEAQRLHWSCGVATSQPARFVDIGVYRDQSAVEVFVQRAMAAG